MSYITKMGYLNPLHANVPRYVHAETLSTLIIVPALDTPEPCGTYSSIDRFPENLAVVQVGSNVMVVVAVADGHYVCFCGRRGEV